MGEAILNFLATSGLASITWQQAVMLLVSFVLMYLAIVKQYEPLLLLPIAFGMFLALWAASRTTPARPSAFSLLNSWPPISSSWAWT